MGLDDRLRTVADKERRNVLYSLSDAEQNELTFEELYENLSDDGVVQDSMSRFETRLYHVHLPKMEDQGLIEYDEDQELVRYELDGRFEDLLQNLESYEN